MPFAPAASLEKTREFRFACPEKFSHQKKSLAETRAGPCPIDPTVLEQSPERAVHRPRAQTDPAVAQCLDVLHEPVAVAGLRGETQEDPEGRLAEGLDPFSVASCDDMSHGDILRKPHHRVNKRPLSTRAARSPGWPPPSVL